MTNCFCRLPKSGDSFRNYEFQFPDQYYRFNIFGIFLPLSDDKDALILFKSGGVDDEKRLLILAEVTLQVSNLPVFHV